MSIVTKGALIVRDLDILGELAELGLVSVGVSITTLDNELKTKLEPRTASPGARLRMVRELKAAGVPVGIMMAPVIPFINDHEIETVVARSAEAGAEFAGYVMLRLPFEVKDLFEEWLAEHYPLKAEHVMSRVREMRGGKSYQAEWGVRMRGQGVYADLVAKRFEVARRKHGLDVSRRGRTQVRPIPSGPGNAILSVSASGRVRLHGRAGSARFRGREGEPRAGTGRCPLQIRTG